IEITDQVEFVTLLFQPDVREAIRAHEVGIISGTSVEHIRTRHRPRHPQSHLIRPLPGRVIAVKVERRWGAGWSLRATGPEDLLELRGGFAERRAAVSPPGVGRAQHEDRGLPPPATLAHDERNVLEMLRAVVLKPQPADIDARLGVARDMVAMRNLPTA